METKVIIFKRLPPGDRWVEIDGDQNRVFTPLTHALEYYFQKHGGRKFYIDAGEGCIYSVDETAPPPEPTFSIYGDF